MKFKAPLLVLSLNSGQLNLDSFTYWGGNKFFMSEYKIKILQLGFTLLISKNTELN